MIEALHAIHNMRVGHSFMVIEEDVSLDTKALKRKYTYYE